MEPGTSFGPYRIERELGVGGMGTVYAAVAEGAGAAVEIGARVALKVVHPHLLASSNYLQRFQREAELGQAVQSPNVVRTYACDRVQAGGGDHHALAMELVEGHTLRALANELERVPEELCLHVAREVCKGLIAIHAVGALHRDVKPENVLITPGHEVKVMDLGVARLQDEAVRLSRTGEFVGSLHYAAPESFRSGGREVDARADLHALGLVLYELASGTNPYDADSVPEIVQRVLHDEPRRLGELEPQLSAFFEELVHCLLAKDPDERLGSASELLDVLTTGEESDWWRRRAAGIRSRTHRPLRRIRIPRETAVYGREQELERLRELFRAAASADGAVVLLEGEAGIGKSRLVDELVACLEADGEDFHFLFGSYPPGGAATASGGFSTAYREQFGQSGCADHLAGTPTLIPAFDAFLRGEPSPPGSAPLSRDALQTCFVNTTRALAGERTTIVLVDDLHFAPDEGRALFTALAMAVPGHRILLIGTLRPGVSEEWTADLTRLEHAHPLTLQRLGPKDLMRLLEDTLRSVRLARELGGQVSLKSEGNPFFVFEIIRGLREGRFITQRGDGTWVSTGVIDEVRVPSSVVDLVNARVAGLTEDERALLDVAACWGFTFDPTLVGDVLGLARIPALRAFGQIERRHRLVRSAGRNYVFDHHQVQEALYGSLNEQLREEYHAALAGVLEARTDATTVAADRLEGDLAVDLAGHFLRGTRPEAALRYLQPAHVHLERSYLRADAVALSERALALPRVLQGQARARALLRLTDSLNGLGRRARQEECAREAGELSAALDDVGLRASAARALGIVLARTARHGDALEQFEQARVWSEAAGDRRGAASAVGNIGTALKEMGRTQEAIGHLREALDRHRSEGFTRGETIARSNLGNALHDLGRLAEAQAEHEAALALAKSVGDRAGEAVATGNLGGVLHARGRLDDARRLNERQLEMSRRVGHRYAEAVALYNLGSALRDAGEDESAEETWAECETVCAEIGERRVRSCSVLERGVLDVERGATQVGRTRLERARIAASECGALDVETRALAELACLDGGDPSAAVAAFDRSADRFRSADRLRVRLVLWRATGERAYLADAKELLDTALAKVGEETRETMLSNLRHLREIDAAWATLADEESR